MEMFIPVSNVAMGKRIAQIRKTSGKTVEEFAEMLCVSENAVYKWQRGDSAPDINNIGMISQMFGVSTDYLILGKEMGSKQGFGSRAA